MGNIPPIPFFQSYWAIPEKLLAGYYPGHPEPQKADAQLRAMLNCGIRHVINLMEPDEVNHQGQPFVPYIEQMRNLANEPVGFSRFPIRDVSIPAVQTMRAILDDIDAALAARKPVYVHCWGGKGRTGTVIGCYLIRHEIKTNAEVLDHITHLRRNIQPYRPSPETAEQCDFVRAWKPGD